MKSTFAAAALVAGAAASYDVAASMPDSYDTNVPAAYGESAPQGYGQASSGYAVPQSSSYVPDYNTATGVAASYAGLPASASAAVAYHTTVMTSTEFVCPEGQTTVFAGHTYTAPAGKPTTITWTAPEGHALTMTQPVYVTSSVNCAGAGCAAPTASAGSGAASYGYPSYSNGTTGSTLVNVPSGVAGQTGGSYPTSTQAGSSPVATAGAGQVAAISGAGLAGLLSLVAYVL